jgi:hypothetical protein
MEGRCGINLTRTPNQELRQVRWEYCLTNEMKTFFMIEEEDLSEDSSSKKSFSSQPSAHLFR